MADVDHLDFVVEIGVIPEPPSPPKPPCTRTEYLGFLCAYFGPSDRFEEWLAEPWWRRVLDITVVPSGPHKKFR